MKHIVLFVCTHLDNDVSNDQNHQDVTTGNSMDSPTSGQNEVNSSVVEGTY